MRFGQFVKSLHYNSGSKTRAVCEAYVCWRLEQPESTDWPELKLEDRVDFGSVRMLLAKHRAAAGGGGTWGTGSDGFGQPWTYVEDACLLSLANGLQRRMQLLAICRCAAILLPRRGVSQTQARMRKHQELKKKTRRAPSPTRLIE